MKEIVLYFLSVLLILLMAMVGMTLVLVSWDKTNNQYKETNAEVFEYYEPYQQKQ